MKQTLLKSALAGTLIASAVVVAGAQRHATKQDVQRQYRYGHVLQRLRKASG